MSGSARLPEPTHNLGLPVGLDDLLLGLGWGFIPYNITCDDGTS